MRRSPAVVVRFVVVAAVFASNGASAAPPPRADPEPAERVRTLTQIGRDYRQMFRGKRLLRLGLAFGAGGALANSDGDAELYEEYRDLASAEQAAGLASAGKALGEEAGMALIVLPALVAGLGESAEDGPVGRWWRRSARAYVVGAPALYYLQQISGGSRPGEPEGSSWRPFEGNHGVSGHAFFGAVPLLTAARTTERRWLKALAITAALVPAWSRVHEEYHYPSQALLGWVLAWEATGAVREGGDLRRFELVPVSDGGAGVGAGIRLVLP